METNVPLYCYSKSSVEQLKDISKKGKVYLNTSKKFELGIGNIPFMDYKHYYEFRLKPKCYGVDINKFVSLFTKRKQEEIHDVLYWKAPRGTFDIIHRSEEEVIVDFNSLNLIKEIKNPKLVN